MAAYQFAFAGGGMAALSLAHRLVTGPFPDASILIVDPERKTDNDRTWCYWSRRPEHFDPIVWRRWPALAFRSRFWEAEFDLAPYDYRMLRAVDFYRTVYGELERHRSVEFRETTVEAVTDGTQEATLSLPDGNTTAEWVFDSRFTARDYETWSGPHHFLKQHFLGWVIETEAACFDPGVATLFDFRTPQLGQMRFVYVLPFDRNRALVEYTLFSAELLSPGEYVAALAEYVEAVLRPGPYRVIETEKGVIPMTDRPFRRREGRRILAIGTRGGRVKASTGYAFHRTQRDSDAIVDSLVRRGHPFDVPRAPAGSRTLDTMLLQTMHRRGELSEKVFSLLFSRNPVDRLFRFLDEEAGAAETLAVMATVPWWPFIQAFFRTKVLRRI